MSDNWETIRESLLILLGRDVYKKWIDDIKHAKVDGERVILSVPSRFSGDYITEHYDREIIKCFRRAGKDVSSVKYRVVRPEPDTRQRKQKPLFKQTVSKGQGGLRPDRSCNFDNFVVGEANGKAHAAAWQIANGPQQSFKSLYLHGHVGLGKSHLLHAVCWMLIAQSPNLKYAFLTGQHFSDHFVKANQNSVLLDFRERLRSADVLLVDDIQFILGKKGTTQEFDLTLSHFLSENKLIILTGLNPIEDMKEFGPRINSRLQQGLAEKLSPPSYELRLGILKQKILDERQNGLRLNFADGVLEFIADKIAGDVRRLEGALQRAILMAQYLHRETVTFEMTEQALSDVVSSQRPPTVEEIITAVAKYHGVGEDDIRGPKRVRNIVRARQMGIFLANELTSKSFPYIGSCFGRDRTTIIHSINQINNLRQKDRDIEQGLAKIRRSLKDSLA